MAKARVTPRSIHMLHEIITFKRPMPAKLLAEVLSVKLGNLDKLATSLPGCFWMDANGNWQLSEHGRGLRSLLGMPSVDFYPHPKAGKFDDNTFGAATALRYLTVNGQGQSDIMAKQFGCSEGFFKRALKQLVARGDATRRGHLFIPGEGGTNYIMLTPTQRTTLVSVAVMNKSKELQPAVFTATDVFGHNGGKLRLTTVGHALADLTVFGYTTRASKGVYQLTAKGYARGQRLARGEDLAPLEPAYAEPADNPVVTELKLTPPIKDNIDSTVGAMATVLLPKPACAAPASTAVSDPLLQYDFWLPERDAQATPKRSEVNAPIAGRGTSLWLPDVGVKEMVAANAALKRALEDAAAEYAKLLLRFEGTHKALNAAYVEIGRLTMASKVG